MLMLTSGSQSRPWRVAFILAFFLTTFLPMGYVHAADSAASPSSTMRLAQKSGSASVVDLRGTWTLSWRGARDNYTGTLVVSNKVDANKFSGTIETINSKGVRVTQDAVLIVGDGAVTINCSNPSQTPYYPDNFYVNYNGKFMTGHSVDSSGQLGSSITFTFQKR